MLGKTDAVEHGVCFKILAAPWWCTRVFVLLFGCLLFECAFARSISAFSQAIPPRAPQRPNVTNIFGDVVVDNYYWMRNRSDPQLLDYIAAENRYADQQLKNLAPFASTIAFEMKSRIPRGESEESYSIGAFLYYSEYDFDHPYPIWYRKRVAQTGVESYLPEVVLNLNDFGSAEHLELALLAPSPDERLIAFAIDFSGNERLTLFVREISGIRIQRELVRIENVSYSLAWSADSTAFFYTRAGLLAQPLMVFRHLLSSSDAHSDQCVYSETDATYELFLSSTNDNEYITINANGLESSEVHYVRAATAQTDSFTVFQPREKTVRYFLEHNNGYFYVFTNNNSALNYEIIRVRTETQVTSSNVSEVVLPHSGGRLLLQMEMHREHLVVFARESNDPQVIVLTLNAPTASPVFLSLPPHLVDFSIQSSRDSMNIYELVKFTNFNSTRVQFTASSFIVPPETYEYDLQTGRLTLLSRVTYSHYIPSQYTTRKVFVPARDGALIAVSLAYHRTAVDLRSGSNALLLNAYGAYGDTQGPYFDTEIFAALDRGVVFARAHVRGSAMNGTAWYMAGKALTKRNSCYDVIDVAEWLVAQSIAAADRIALVGRSAGGLLMSCVLTMRPDLAAVVMLHVPFVDVVNTMLDPTISYTVWEYSEWGNPTIAEHYKYMRSYDPYQNIRATRYPSVYITTGWNDVLVNYWEPVKFTARMRETIAYGEIVLRVSDAGHAGLTGDKYYDDLGVQFAFLLNALQIDDGSWGTLVAIASAFMLLSASALFFDLWRAPRA